MRAKSSARSTCCITCGTSTSTAIPTSSRSMSATCAARSTYRSRGRASRRCGAPGIGCERTVADVAGPGRRHTLSLRAQLTVLATLVITAAVAAATLILYRQLSSSLQHSVDNSARTELRAVVTSLAGGDPAAAQIGAEADTVIQVVDPAGAVVASSTNADGLPALFRFPSGTRAKLYDDHALPIRDSADVYRVATAATADGRRVYVGVASDDARGARRVVSTAAAFGLPLLAALVAAVVWLLVGRALRPVESLIDRLDDSQRRQRELVSNAAHELRSPLAALRTQLEVAVATQHVDADDLRPALAEVDRVAGITDDLLHLARLDSVRDDIRDPVDLDDVVFAEVTRVRSAARVSIDVSDLSAAQVCGDAVALRRLVRNLLDNAVRHANAGVSVSLRTDAGDAVLVVADDGPGIPAGDRERVFERFTRLDPGRARADGGVGLGLAIVREVAERHGGSAVVADGPSATFVVRIPARTDEALPAQVRRTARPRASDSS